MYYSNKDNDFVKEVKRIILDWLSEEEKQAYQNWLAEMHPTKKRTYVPDLILPKGCVKLGWEYQTVVEIRHTIFPDTPLKIKNKHDANKYQIVLIYYISPYASFHQTKLGLRLMSYEELCDHTDNRELKFIGQSVELPSNEEKKENCKNAFKKGKCVLFIGAGVSMSAGLPGWDDLLFNILENAYDGIKMRRDDEVFLKRAFDGSTMVTARYLRTLIDSNENRSNDKFIDKVKKSLYLNEADKETKLLKSIVELIHYGQQRKRNVNKIITYNYDDLLEFAIKGKGDLTPYAVCYKDDVDNCNKDLFPVYHVHGLISKYYNPSDNGEYIVLSEESYNDLYNKGEKGGRETWINSVQMNALNGNTCLFIGMSMSDPNLRRLLEASRLKKGDICRHFAFLSERNFYTNQSFIPEKKIVDKMFYELGVNVIWYNDHEELPGLLMELMK